MRCRQRSEGKKGRRGGKTYGARFRSFKRFGSERGMRAEAWSLDGEAMAFGAELSALVRGIEFCLLDLHLELLSTFLQTRRLQWTD